MKKECWMCRRTAQEVWDATPDEGSGYPNPDSMMIETSIGDQKIHYCIGCNAILWNFIHGDKQRDEFTVMCLGDLDAIFNEIKKSIDKAIENL